MLEDLAADDGACRGDAREVLVEEGTPAVPVVAPNEAFMVRECDIAESRE